MEGVAVKAWNVTHPVLLLEVILIVALNGGRVRELSDGTSCGA